LRKKAAQRQSVGTSPKQEKWSLHQEWSSAVQAAHPSYNGLLMHHLEVCRCYIRILEVLQSTFLYIATNATWYTGNKQIHEDLGVPFFTDHIRSLPERYISSKLADVGNPLVMQLSS
jgi:hypothetical protein